MYVDNGGVGSTDLTIVNPVDGAIVCGTLTVNVATTSEIVSVDFFVDGQAYASDSTTPFEWDWDTTGLSDASHVLTAIGTGTGGDQTQDMVAVAVDNSAGTCDNLPTVSFVTPVPNSYHLADVEVDVSASDDVGVVLVQVFIDGGLIFDDSTTPFEGQVVADDFAEGPHLLRAVATDTSDQTSAAEMYFTFDFTGPEQDLTSPLPLGDSGVVQDEVVVEALATDNYLLEAFSVELSDGTLFGDSASGVVSANWDTRDWADGNYTIELTATDAAGHTVTDRAWVEVDNDEDGDGYAGFDHGGTDCDDADSSVNPGESEITCDGVDNDCNVSTEDEPDQDSDGYSVCEDCDDSDANNFPNGTEDCYDGGDNDCDSAVDWDDGDCDYLNQPPSQPVIEIQPSSPDDGDDLECVVTTPSTDPEGYSVVYFYEWLVDGSPSGLTTDIVDSSETQAGEEWTCTVTPHDGVNPGPSASSSIEIAWADPGGFHITASFDATGGSGPGTATVDLTLTLVDEQTHDDLCEYTFRYTGTYPVLASAQGDDYYEYIDLVIDFTSGYFLQSDCPADFDDYVTLLSDPLGTVEWWLDPIAVITCDMVNAVPSLAATQFIDDLYGVGLTDGTLDSWCNEYGPMVEAGGSAGPMEGVWLRPADSSWGGGTFNIEYFTAPNGDIGGLGTYDSWCAMGFVHAEVANSYEPQAGISGVYELGAIWMWMFN